MVVLCGWAMPRGPLPVTLVGVGGGEQVGSDSDQLRYPFQVVTIRRSYSPAWRSLSMNCGGPAR